MRRRSIGWILVLAATGAGLLATGVASAGTLPNEFCPVQTDKKALPEFSTIHEGRTIHFCCEDCLEAFTANPQEFLANLPAVLRPSGRPTGHDHPPGWRPPGFGESGPASSVGVEEQPEGHSPIELAFKALAAVRWSAFALLPVLVFLRYREARRPPAERTRFNARRVFVFSAGALLFLAMAWEIMTLAYRVRGLEGTLEATKVHMAQHLTLEVLHYATFLDFGTPPLPARPKLPKRLAGTFYRGNDERDPSLFNGGHYRTATFHVSVRNQDHDVEYGQDVGSAPLFVRLEIERGPNTPDFFWHSSRMNTMYLTRATDPALGAQAAPIADRVGLTELAPRYRWEALYPIGPAPPGEASRSGVVYVREQLSAGARFHFGIQYDLRFRHGKLTRDSDIFMGALYRTRRVLPSNLPLHEWFSHEPIPTLPVPRTADLQTLQAEDDSAPGRTP